MILFSQILPPVENKNLILGRNNDMGYTTKYGLISNERNSSLFNRFKNFRNLTSNSLSEIEPEDISVKGSLYNSTVRLRDQRRKTNKLQLSISIKNLNQSSKNFAL